MREWELGGGDVQEELEEMSGRIRKVLMETEEKQRKKGKGGGKKEGSGREM